MQKIHENLEAGIKLTQDEKNKRKYMNIEFYPSRNSDGGWDIDYTGVLNSILRFDYSAIDNVAFLFSNIRNEEKYYEALEINLIKKAIIKKWIGIEDDNRYRDFHTPQFNNEDYNENPSYEKYGGAYDLDDDTIDFAFEGDPENYQNID